MEREVNNMDKYKELYDYSEAIAKRYFRFYAKSFLSNAMDIEDLMQEGKITVWQTIKKYTGKSVPELKKLVGQAVGWRLNYFRLLSPSVSYKFINLYDLLEHDTKYDELSDTKNEESNFNMEEEDEITIYQTDKMMELPMKSEGILEESNGVLDDLEELCSKEMYDILYKYFIEERTLEDIGKIYNLTKQGVKFLIRDELKRLKKYYF